MSLGLKQKCALPHCLQVKDLKACAACSDVLYCSREHQVEHFKEGGHKMVCPGRVKGEPLTFQQCSERATQYHEQKMWIAALPYYSAMLELTERVLGLVHPQVGSLLHVIANLHRMNGKIDNAILCLQRVLLVRDLTDTGTAREYKESFTIMGLLSELYVQTENIPYAIELLKKTEEVARKEFGESSFELGRTLCALGGCYEKAEDHEAAENHLRQAIAISSYANPTDLEEKQASSNGFFNLAVILCGRNRIPEAVPFFRQCLQLRIDAGMAPDHPDMLEVQQCIADCEAAPSQSVGAAAAPISVS